jgi:hypothetical protein
MLRLQKRNYSLVYKILLNSGAVNILKYTSYIIGYIIWSCMFKIIVSSIKYAV